jgi:hypothetical protein
LIDKVSYYLGSDPRGPSAIPLFTRKTDGYFEKIAAPKLLTEVVKYIENLKPRSDAQYVLVNAMGAGEFWGSNINGDWFPEAALIHKPDSWTGNPLLDKIRSKDWPYGFPTFYNAKPFLHHRNKDFPPHNHPSFGEIELAAWNPRMKRVELVHRIDRDLCMKGGGMSLWDKLKNGDYPDTSMGCKVPFDTCSICLDWDRYKAALATFDPDKQKSPGEAVLAVHEKKPIRGVSKTRNDYCDHAKNMMNRILSDGRKVFVYNDFPKFFDDSFVFIGADKTAKMMMKLAEDAEFSPVARAFYGVPAGSAAYSPELDSNGGFDQSTKSEAGEEQKVAETLECGDWEGIRLLFKAAKSKDAEISKEVVPSQFAGKAIPVLTKSEPDLPKDVLDALATRSPEEALSTTTGLGVVLRPHEFQRMMLKGLGQHSMADELERAGLVFPKSEEETPIHLQPSSFSDLLAKLLLPLLSGRSAFGPFIERRCVMIVAGPQDKKEKRASSLSTPLLRKMGAAYNGYRRQMMDFITESQSVLAQSSLGDSSLSKLAHHPVNELFTPLSAAYLRDAFIDEMGEPTIKQAEAGVERGFPSKNTRDLVNLTGGSPCRK